MRTFEYERAEDTAAALGAHDGGSAAYLAGGTTLLDLVKLDVMRPARVIDVNRLPLDHIERLDDGRLRVGATVRNTDLAYDPHVLRDHPVLSEALLQGASRQLRNRATTAGNLMQRVRCGYFRDGVSPCNKRAPGTGCAAMDGRNRDVFAVLGTSESCIAAHPSDMCVAVAAIGARVEVTGQEGPRTLDFADLHELPGDTPHIEHALAPGELITHLTLDAPLADAGSCYVKLRDRASYQFALASCAAIVSLEGDRLAAVRLALGGVGTKPWRCRDVEAATAGAPATPETYAEAARRALEGARPMRHNAFKIPLAQRAVARALSTAVERARHGAAS